MVAAHMEVRRRPRKWPGGGDAPGQGRGDGEEGSPQRGREGEARVKRRLGDEGEEGALPVVMGRA